MRIERFRHEDVDTFLTLASLENWVADRWEFEFLLSSFPQGCFALRSESGETAGFVTAVRHEKSGWIGNLIVAEKFRNRGFGETLFLAALYVLRDEGVETFWLTASTAGMPLYRKHGFARLDTIIRWVGIGRQRHAGHDGPNDDAGVPPIAARIDALAWGDRRDALMSAAAGHGMLMTEGDGSLVIQPSGENRQFGPFSAIDSSSAEKVFHNGLRTIPLGTKIYLDAPISNRNALRIFNRKRFRIAGTTELMYAGTRPDYRPELLYGLATMGSCG